MDAFKGTHALLTTFSVLFLCYVTWTFFTTGMATIQDDTLTLTLFWTSYILVFLGGTLGVPYLIAFTDNSSANIFTAWAGIAIYTGTTIITRMLYPLITSLISNLTEQLHIQWLTFFWIVAVTILLYILPLLTQHYPEIFMKQEELL